MGQIGREFEREQSVVQVQVFTDVLAHRCIRSQLQQTTVVVRQLQFFGRAQHALAFHTTQLADLDHKGLAVFTGRQLGPDQRARHADTHTRIGRTADNIQQFGLTNIHSADTQTISIGVLLGGLDFTHDDLGERRRNGFELLHFQTGHGERLGQHSGRDGRIAEGAEPGFRELHSSNQFWNCDRKRTSPSKNRRRSFTP